ncbi:TetR/AcrR family transcriptional regulator [bacterium AH-315-F18]|nr:TetR/AcrR family transcriptional regulator [bacterium AH-315-F18]
MAKSKSSTRAITEVDVRERLLDAAGELFYREGIRAVGIDRVLKEARAAKASLYLHFKSKAELVSAYLDRAGLQWQALMEAELSPIENPRKRLLALFDLMGAFSCEDGFRGCPLGNATGELADPAHPAHAVLARHRNWLAGWVVDCVRDMGVRDSKKLGRAVFLLYVGTLTVAQFDDEAVATARWAAVKLLDGAARRT